MENQKKRRGRPRVLTDDERRERRTNYMLNKDWFCETCKLHFSLASKWSHLKTDKHMNNYIKTIHEM